MGSNDDTYIVITNLGHILQPGDTALGYDIKNLVLNSESEVLMEKLTHTPPDVILVRKSYPDAKKKRKKRAPRKDKKKRSDNDNSSTASGDDISVATDGNDIGILGFVDDLDADQRQQIYEEEEALLDEERHLLKNNNLNTIEETADEDSNLKQSLEENEDN